MLPPESHTAAGALTPGRALPAWPGTVCTLYEASGGPQDGGTKHCPSSKPGGGTEMCGEGSSLPYLRENIVDAGGRHGSQTKQGRSSGAGPEPRSRRATEEEPALRGPESPSRTLSALLLSRTGTLRGVPDTELSGRDPALEAQKALEPGGPEAGYPLTVPHRNNHGHRCLFPAAVPGSTFVICAQGVQVRNVPAGPAQRPSLTRTSKAMT